MDEEMIQTRDKIWKKAQATIFIILALLIVVSVIALLFMIRKPQPKPQVTHADDFKTTLVSCIRPYIDEAIELVMKQGGYINPRAYKLYNNIPVAYLCYTRNYYEACINQEPLLIEHIEEELRDYLQAEIENCFSLARKEFEAKSYEVSLGTLEFYVWLKPRTAEFIIKRDTIIRKEESSQRFSDFSIRIKSPIYDLAAIAQEIVNSEAKWCHFEDLGYTVLHHNKIKIERKKLGDETKIYTIRDVQSGQEMYIAIKSCVPAPL